MGILFLKITIVVVLISVPMAVPLVWATLRRILVPGTFGALCLKQTFLFGLLVTRELAMSAGKDFVRRVLTSIFLGAKVKVHPVVILAFIVRLRFFATKWLLTFI